MGKVGPRETRTSNLFKKIQISLILVIFKRFFSLALTKIHSNF